MVWTISPSSRSSCSSNHPVGIKLVRQGIESILSPKQQRRPLPALLSLSFFYAPYPSMYICISYNCSCPGSGRLTCRCSPATPSPSPGTSASPACTGRRRTPGPSRSGNFFRNSNLATGQWIKIFLILVKNYPSYWNFLIFLGSQSPRCIVHRRASFLNLNFE